MFDEVCVVGDEALVDTVDGVVGITARAPQLYNHIH